MQYRGQTQIYLLVLGIIFLVTVYSLFSFIQVFATGAAGTPGLPVEVADFINLNPFFALAMITIGIIVAVARPSVGF